MRVLNTNPGGGGGGGSSPVQIWSTHFSDYMQLNSYGQSNSNGTDGQPAFTTTPLYGNKMFNTGIRKKVTEEEEHSSSLSYTSLTNLIETDLDSTWGETGVAGAANFLLEKLVSLGGWGSIADIGFSILGTAGGQGSANLNTLSKGQTRFNENIAMTQAGYDICTGLNKTISYLATMMSHGEADTLAGRTRDFYAAGSKQLATDIDTTVTNITGQVWRPPFLFALPAMHLWYYDSTSHTTSPRPEIALGMRDACVGQSNMFVACSRYAEDYGAAALHSSNNGHHSRHLYFARALAKIIVARLNNTAIAPFAVDLIDTYWQGNTTDLQFSVPHGKLTYDTSYVAACINKGFDLWQSDGFTINDIITAVDIVGRDRIRVTYSGTPAAGSRLTYAFGRPATDTTTGPASRVGGNIRDTEGTVDTWIDSTSTTRPLHNYMNLFETIKQG